MASYDFETLSPLDFELLVRDLLYQEYGWRLETFRRGPDGGVDLRLASGGNRVIVQCKHYARSSFADLRKAARVELAKMAKEAPTRYLFVTSMELTRANKDALASELSPWLESSNDLLCRPELNAILGSFPEVERDHFKLWLASTTILDRIVHSGAWQRSHALMEDIRDRVKLYVSTNSFSQASKILQEKRVVVLTGSPGVGKTMLAEMLCLDHWERGWQVIDIYSHRMEECWDLARGDAHQVFLFDDVFGQTDLNERLGRGTGSLLGRFMDYVTRNTSKRLIVTSRLQVLLTASQRDERVKQANLTPKMYMVEIKGYDPIHKARVLYNHLYFSSLSRKVVADFVSAGSHKSVVKHQNFNPRIVQQVALRQEHSSATELADRLLESLDNPSLVWGPSFRESLDALGRRLLLQLAAFPVSGAAPSELRSRVVDDVEPITYTDTLRSLEGTWIRTDSDRPMSSPTTKFNDPSCRDFVLAFLNEETAYLRSVLSRAVYPSEKTTLLGYALSRVYPSNEPKFPGFREWVARNSTYVAEQVVACWDESIELHDDAATRLATALDLDAEFDLGLDSWLHDTTYAISGRLESQLRIVDCESAEQLVRNLLRSGVLDSVDGEQVNQLEEFFEAWLISAFEEGEWKAAGDLLADIDGSSAPTELYRRLCKVFDFQFEQWLDAQIGDVSSNTGSFEEAERHLAGLYDFATNYMSAEKVGSRVESERHSQEDKYLMYEPTPDELEHMRYSTIVPSPDSDGLLQLDGNETVRRPDDEIDSIFKQLE